MKCVICKHKFTGRGHNADPVAKGSCCNTCNLTRVIPMRMRWENKIRKLESEARRITSITEISHG